jgi:mannan endo-1,4-beta-mannosidase
LFVHNIFVLLATSLLLKSANQLLIYQNQKLSTILIVFITSNFYTMKKITQYFALCILSIGHFINLLAQNPVPKLTDRSKSGIIVYLNSIIKIHQVIVGQQCSETPDVALSYKNNFQSLYDSSGRYPALLGLDYGWFKNTDLAATNHFAINHWRAGGLVTICWHAACPWRDIYNVRFNSIENKDSIDLSKLLKDAPNSKAKNKYRSELMRIAAALKQLKDSGVIVLWRPFHEMNGSWFWWGVNDNKEPTNQGDYKALWKDMYETFFKDFGLDN